MEHKIDPFRPGPSLSRDFTQDMNEKESPSLTFEDFVNVTSEFELSSHTVSCTIIVYSKCHFEIQQSPPIATSLRIDLWI